MALSIETATRVARAEEINTALGGGAKVKFYTGSAPASVNDTTNEALLAECVCHATAFGSVNGTTAVLSAQNVAGETYVAREDSAPGTGTIGFCRITDSSDNAILQFSTVGTTGSGMEVILPSLSVTTGEAVEVTSISITEGNA